MTDSQSKKSPDNQQADAAASFPSSSSGGPSLLPVEKAKTEAEIRSRYIGQFTFLVLAQGPIIAWVLYYASTAAVSALSSSSSDGGVQPQDLLDSKIEFLYNYELYYVYLAVFLIYITRLVLVVNANGARAPTRLDRPDQHIYQVVVNDSSSNSSGSSGSAGNLVLMANDGVNGRFNRAQRGIFNMDEGLPLFLMSVLLVSPILGPLVCFGLVPLYMYGRIKCAHDYKQDCSTRTGGFLYAMIAEHGMAALVGLILVKTFYYGFSSS